MNKKSFFISLGFHFFLGVIVIFLIFFVEKPQKERYIPIYLKDFYPHTKLFATSQKIDNNIKKVYHVHEIKHIHKVIKYKILTQKVSNEKSIIKTIPIVIKKHINIKKQQDTKKQQNIKKTHAILKKIQKIFKKHQVLNAKDIQQQQMIERQYFNYIYRLIGKYKTYPLIARELEQTGTVKLKFVIFKNGHISNITVDTSSGFIVLDKAAKKILLKIKYFKPIPITLNQQQLQIIIPISYQLN